MSKKNRRTRRDRDMEALNLEAMKEAYLPVISDEEDDTSIRKNYLKDSKGIQFGFTSKEERAEQEASLTSGYEGLGEVVRKDNISDTYTFNLPTDVEGEVLTLTGPTFIDKATRSDSTFIIENFNGTKLLVLCTSERRPFGVEYSCDEESKVYVEEGSAYLDYINDPWSAVYQWLRKNDPEIYATTTYNPTFIQYHAAKRSAMHTFCKTYITNPLFKTEKAHYAMLNDGVVNFFHLLKNMPPHIFEAIDGPHSDFSFDPPTPTMHLNLLNLFKAIKNGKNWMNELMDQVEEQVTDTDDNYNILHFSMKSQTIANLIYHDLLKNNIILYFSSSNDEVCNAITIASPRTFRLCEMLMEMKVEFPDIVEKLSLTRARDFACEYEFTPLDLKEFFKVIEEKGIRLLKDKGKTPKIVAPAALMGLLVKASKNGLLKKVGISYQITQKQAPKPSRKSLRKKNKAWGANGGFKLKISSSNR